MKTIVSEMEEAATLPLRL